MFELAAALSLAAWLYLVFAHGRFWLADQRLDGREPAPALWPDVVAVVPARDEADLVPRTVRALLDQEYAGRLRIVLVDDESADGTADAARDTAKGHPRGARLEVVRAAERPAGWVGKMWAVESGLRAAERAGAAPAWWWLSDADVLHAPDSLARLVAKGCAEKLDLVSLMVKLDRGRGWNALLVPAFVYFFQLLYPFPRVNDPSSRVAGAAGGCMLVRADALARAGGIESLRGEVIDDCALGRALKRGGKIWLGLADRETSIRPYEGIADVWNMVARSAYTQLDHSPALVAGTLAGLAVLYLVPPLSVLAWLLGADSSPAAFGAAAWALQAASFVPTLTLYGRSPWLALALPAAGLLYAAMTLDSARRHWRNEGATWKGRAGAGAE
ncbi:MAG TPA: glycosyltransferase [Myxococcota bacterium]|nr:glycosyltransferase [Myxococcota bacterium]